MLKSEFTIIGFKLVEPLPFNVLLALSDRKVKNHGQKSNMILEVLLMSIRNFI